MQCITDHAYSNAAQIELTRDSALLEERLKPPTAELNEQSLRVNHDTWTRNCFAAEENASFLIDYCIQLANEEFRPNSPADCRRVLGVDSSDKDSLSQLFNEGNLLAGAILDARSAISRWSQLKAWGKFARFGRVQPVWDSLGTPHGRYTSAGPCLNNRIESIRETIEPDPGYSFLSLDLNQAEYVTWASLSGDKVLGQAFLEGRDFHVEMVTAIRERVPVWDLRGQDPRAAGKTINFAILYQIQPHTLARMLGCSVAIANKIIEAYYSRVPTAAFFISSVLAAAKTRGYVETHYGRRRYCSELALKSTQREIHEIEKTCWNHVNAGTAAEYLKWKQVLLWESLRREGLKPDHVKLSVQMFDELILQVRDDVLCPVQQIAEPIMQAQVKGFFPFRVTVKVGKTWRECSK